MWKILLLQGYSCNSTGFGTIRACQILASFWQINRSTRFGPIHVENFALARIFLQFNRFWNYTCLKNSGKLLSNQLINSFWTHTCGKFCSCKDIPAIQQVLELYVFEKFGQAFVKSTDQLVLDP